MSNSMTYGANNKIPRTRRFLWNRESMKMSAESSIWKAILGNQSIRTNQKLILVCREREIFIAIGIGYTTQRLHSANAAKIVNEIFSTRTPVRAERPINVNVSARRENWVSCNALKYLFLHPSDKAAACRADVYRFLGIPSCLDIAADLLSSWSTGSRTLRHATNFGYRIGDLPERILPHYSRNPTGIGKNRIILKKETDELWLMVSRILPRDFRIYPLH